MAAAAWELKHSVEIEASLSFAWGFMSNVSNWDDPPAEFHLDGAFVAGARGYTQSPGQPPQPWRLIEVHPEESYTLELALAGATLAFTWRFHTRESRTILTQQIVLSGENAPAFIDLVRDLFGANLEPGMKRVARAIDEAYSRSKN